MRYKKTLPSIVDAVEFRREQYGWTMSKMAFELGIQLSHYSEFVHKKRNLPINAIRHAYRIGVPEKVLMQFETPTNEEDV